MLGRDSWLWEDDGLRACRAEDILRSASRTQTKTLCQSQLDDEEPKLLLESKPDPKELAESNVEEKSLDLNAEPASQNTWLSFKVPHALPMSKQRSETLSLDEHVDRSIVTEVIFESLQEENISPIEIDGRLTVEDQFETFSETLSIAEQKKSPILLNILDSRLSSKALHQYVEYELTIVLAYQSIGSRI